MRTIEARLADIARNHRGGKRGHRVPIAAIRVAEIRRVYKDRFRFILKSRSADGFWVCNQCTPQPRPGIELVMKFAGKDFLGAARIVDEIIGGNRYMPLQPRADQKIDMLHRYRFPIEMWRRGNVIRPDDVSDRWLHNRGLGMDAYPPCLRTSSRERYRDSDRGDLISWHPCMLALVRDAQGKPITIARTYLTEDGQKADVPRPRKPEDSAILDLEKTLVREFFSVVEAA